MRPGVVTDPADEIQSFDITHTDIKGQKTGFRRNRTLGQVRASLPALLPLASRRQRNITVRPHRPATVLLIQLDDLKDPDALQGITPVAFVAYKKAQGSTAKNEDMIFTDAEIDAFLPKN